MKLREGFVSNSSSCSYVIKTYGLQGKQMTIEELKEKLPMSKFAYDNLTVNERESIYIVLWKLLTSEERFDNVEYYDNVGGKTVMGLMVGQDVELDPSLIDEHTSSVLYSYRRCLFNTGNITVQGD